MALAPEAEGGGKFLKKLKRKFKGGGRKGGGGRRGGGGGWGK